MGIFDHKGKRALAALEAVCSGAERGIAALPGPDRCGALIIANALLAAASREWDTDIGGNPSSLPRRRSAAVVVRLADIHARSLDVLSSFGKQEDASPAKAAVLRQIRAVEAVMLLAGVALHHPARAAAAGCWKSLWSARRHAPAAVSLLHHGGTAFGMEAVPRIDPDRPVGKQEMRRLAGELPRVFRRRSKARVSAPGAAGRNSSGPLAANGVITMETGKPRPAPDRSER